MAAGTAPAVGADLRARPGEVMVATDGSCLRNPGGATGWAWVATDGSWASGGQPEGTNQIGELWGVLSALRDYPDEPLAIQVDSTYALNVATTWARGWARNGWRTKSGEPVANLALVRLLHRQMSVRECPVRFIKVPAHTSDPTYALNAAADSAARAAAERVRRERTKGSWSGRDRSLVLPPRSAPKRPRQAEREMPKATAAPRPILCPSCERPINPMGECGCTA